jgi:RimJ/RimL family protein N-acetyltransferase
MTEIPRIETPRLILRGRRLEDFDSYAAMWADAEGVRYAAGQPQSREDSWLRFGRAAGLWLLTGYGPFAVEERKTGRLVGDVGPADYGRDISPPLAGKPEFGWVIARDCWGQGYAREATAAALAWAEDKFPETAFSCIIDPENRPSLALAARFGFREIARSVYKGKSLVVLERAPCGG